jgi:hypothetical protein
VVSSDGRGTYPVVGRITAGVDPDADGRWMMMMMMMMMMVMMMTRRRRRGRRMVVVVVVLMLMRTRSRGRRTMLLDLLPRKQGPRESDVSCGLFAAGLEVKSGQVAYITTGAKMPKGADAVRGRSGREPVKDVMMIMGHDHDHDRFRRIMIITMMV